MTISPVQFVSCLTGSGLMTADEVLALQQGLPLNRLPMDAQQFARELVRRQKLTQYQANMLLQGRSKGLVLGNYVILEKIGQGGMGMVFRARHQRMDRVVAIKVLPPAWTKSDKSVQRFHQEVKSAAKLTHPNIVTAYDADESGGVHFLVMEFVEGFELTDIVKDRGALPVEVAIDYTLQAARGLEYAHQKGVVHRDIKPSNLMLGVGGAGLGVSNPHGVGSESAVPNPQARVVRQPTVDGLKPEAQAKERMHVPSLALQASIHTTRQIKIDGALAPIVKILDMGLARSYNDLPVTPTSDDGTVPVRAGVTQAGLIIGTLDFMAPEQAEDARRADHRADIYSLGCSLYFLLTGEVPFPAETPVETVMAHRDRSIPSLRAVRPDVPQGLDALFQRMLAKKPNDRPQSMSEVIAALEACVKELNNRSRATALVAETQACVVESDAAVETVSISSPLGPNPTFGHRRWVGLAGAISAAAILVVGLIVAFWPPAPKQLAATPPATVPLVWEDPAESVEDSSLVTIPRQPGLVLDGESGGSPGDSANASTRSIPAQDTVASNPQSPPGDTPAEMPPKPDAPSRPSFAAVESPADSDDPLPVSGADRPKASAAGNSSPPSIELERRPEGPRQPNPTYAAGSPTESTPEQAAWEKLVREMIELGWTAKASGLNSAKERFKAAGDLRPNDPRLHFAYGLVLLKHNQYDDALEQFGSVAETSKNSYLPAYRAAIWLRVLRRSYEPAMLDLVSLTRAWQAFEPKPLPEWVQDDFVTWTARMMGYLEGPVDSRSVDALCEQCNQEIRSLLSPDHQALFNKARTELLANYAAKAGAQDQIRLEAKKKQEKSAEETMDRLAKESAQTKDDRKQVEKNAEELEKSLKQYLTEIDSQYTALARDYDRLDIRARTLSTSIRALDQEIGSLIAQRAQATADLKSSDSSNKTGSGTKSSSSSSAALVATIQVAIDRKNYERTSYQSQRDNIEIQGRGIERQGNTLIAKRQSLINDYQTSTGRLFKEKESLSAKEKFLDRKQQETSGKTATGNTTPVKVLGQTAKALRTYVDLNLELEKQRVLDSFARP